MTEHALRLISAGLQPIPLYGPNSHGKDPKSPRVKAWRELQLDLLTPEGVALLPFSSAGAVGIVCGDVSGGLEVVDVDTKYDPTGTLEGEYLAQLEEQAPGLLSRLVVQRTASGGLHLLYRCPGHIQGNQKLAKHASGDVLLETRGEGGYIVCSPSQGYTLERGTFEGVPTISPVERELLLSAAKGFHQGKPLEEDAPRPRRERVHREGGRYLETPLDHYNREADVVALLERYGWARGPRKGDRVPLRRPGKEPGSWSGNFHERLRLVWCWSSSTSFPSERAISPVDVFAHLELGLALPLQNVREVFERLRSEGWGEERPREDYFEEEPAGEPYGDSEPKDTKRPKMKEWNIEELHEDLRNTPPAKPVGWAKLDPHFQLRPGGLAVVGAMPGGGKSLFLVNLLRRLALQYPEEAFVYYSAEMPAKELFVRLVQACIFQGRYRRARWIVPGKEKGALLEPHGEGYVLTDASGGGPGWIAPEGRLLEELLRIQPEGTSFEELCVRISMEGSVELKINPGTDAAAVGEMLRNAQPFEAFAAGYREARELVDSGRVRLVDSAEQRLLVEEIEGHARGVERLGGIVVDYATRLSCKKAQKEQDMRLRVLETSREMCRAAKDLNVPVVLAAQIGREAHGTEGKPRQYEPREDGKPPASHRHALLPVVPDGDKFAESSQFFQDADAAIYLSNPFHGGGVHEGNPFLPMYREAGEGPLFIRVAKQRGGESGVVVELGYVPHGQAIHGLVDLSTFSGPNPLKEGLHQPTKTKEKKTNKEQK
jgi:hypothetical protein